MNLREIILRPVAGRLLKSGFVMSAVKERADLSAFKERPSVRILLGIGTIIFSFVAGWPIVALLGTASVYYDEPLIVLVGGPLVYGLSHGVFILGMYLAGAKYTWIFLRWATRMAMEKLFHPYLPPLLLQPADDIGMVAPDNKTGRTQNP